MADLKIMSKKRFPSYKNHIKILVEEKRSSGKTWAYLNNFIINFLANDCRYALTGKQLKELLDLAKQEVIDESKNEKKNKTKIETVIVFTEGFHRRYSRNSCIHFYRMYGFRKSEHSYCCVTCFNVTVEFYVWRRLGGGEQ